MGDTPLSVPEIARRYESTEHRVRQLVRQGALEPVAIGKYGVHLFDPRDVRMVGQRLRLGRFERVHRQVVVHHQLPDHALALKAVGVEVLEATSIMDGLSQYDGEGACIMVLPAKMPATESGLAAVLIDGLALTIVGNPGDLDARLERRSTVIDPDNYRRLAQLVWQRIEQRIEQTHLRL